MATIVSLHAHPDDEALLTGGWLAQRSAAGDRVAQMRSAIAAAMSRSKREIPHYYLAHEIVMDAALAWLTERNADRPITERLLPAVLQLKAVALAAARYHDVNGFWRGDTFVTVRSVDTLVKRLRRRIEPDAAHPRYLLTVWGVGYKLADV